MKATYWIVALLAGAALAGWFFWRMPQPAAGASGIASPAPVVTANEPAPGASPTPRPQAEVAPTQDQVARWITDVNSADAAARALAITSLANAPREQALPVLRRVLTSGELADRPQAINSLRELALGQGDADGRVREVIREVIYHGDDESLASLAQDALDVVEESEMKQP